MKNEVFETIVSVLSNAKIDAATYNKNKENDAFISKIEDALKEIKKELWIPLSTGNYPPEMTDVQVTFIGHNSFCHLIYLHKCIKSNYKKILLIVFYLSLIFIN